MPLTWHATCIVPHPLNVHAAAVVSEKVRQQILDRQRRMAAAEDAPEMSKPQTAALQRDIAAILLPGESVTRALQRLGKQDKRPAGLCVCVCCPSMRCCPGS